MWESNIIILEILFQNISYKLLHDCYFLSVHLYVKRSSFFNSREHSIENLTKWNVHKIDLPYSRTNKQFDSTDYSNGSSSANIDIVYLASNLFSLFS